jgi:predicted methyltransferase
MWRRRCSKSPGYERAKVVSEKTTMQRPEGARYYVLGDLNFGLSGVDMVTNFRVYHVFGTEDRHRLNQAIYNALRPGGIYAVIDHTARHGEPETKANRRRFDPVKAIVEIQAAGFILQDYSTLHYRPLDQLNLEVGDEQVTDRTDRWVLKFIKPVIKK